ncbi:MAG: hypothetical protein PUJ54_04770 [Lachnospiraceae bacterium]|nr:hypothetical protein [Lachnospiraceae bacterium]MDY4118351.1 hypothetical protein [Lachnospiraceae bacterium]
MYEELRLNIVAEETAVYHTYKDRVFRILFKEKKRLLELYNALNDTDYTNEDDLIVNTLENAIYMKMKNDISFVIDSDMCLFEHQSSYCPNMALRGFLYFADLYKKYVKDVDLSIRKKIMIPAPQYIVFYNGLERKEEEFTQKLSDSFEDGKEGCIELTVRTININYGQNKELMEKCKALAGYSFFVAEVRKNLETMKLEKAVEEAINTCIDKDVLKEFFLEQKGEVMAMSIYEYNEEYVKKSLYEEGLEEGIKEGEKVGVLKTLVKNVEAAMRNFHISLKEACEGLGTTVEEYEKAKNIR